MIKIFLLLIVFIIFLFLFLQNNDKPENFSNVKMKCGSLDAINNQDSDGGGSGGEGSDGGGSGGEGSDGGGSGGGGSGGDSDIPNCVNTQVNLVNVDPNKPECVGICINQHTYTEENIVNDPLKTLEDVGTLKNGQTKADVISTNCGLCIDNFYAGLKNMNDLGSRCSQN